MNYNFLKTLLVVFSVVTLISCDKDYITVGGDIIGGENFNSIPGEEYGVGVYNQRTGPVQSNNLPINQIGVYKNPFFGKTEANFVTQLDLANINPTFGENIAIDSVVMTIPYVSKKTTDAEGNTKYELLDTHGTAAVDLGVYRNNYEILSLSPAPGDNFEAGARYYSNQNATFENVKSGLSDLNALGDYRLNDRYDSSNTVKFEKENVKFLPSDKEIKFYKYEEKKSGNPYVVTYEKTSTIESRIAPAMRLHLNKNYFLNEVIKASASKLESNAAFKKYFKGIYIQAKETGSNAGGTLMSLDFKKGNITIYYTEEVVVKDKDGVKLGTDKPRKTFVMNMTGNSVNLYSNTPTTEYQNFDSKYIYLKGGEGSFAYVDLFTDHDKLEVLKSNNVLVTEASLIFTVNKGLMKDETPDPLRLYLYDVENENVISEYNFDTSTNPGDFKKNKSIFSGILTEEKNSAGEITKRYYKFRITDFVNRILKGTQKNVRLGLAVCENINDPIMSFFETPIDYQNPSGENKQNKKIPRSSVYNPLGTVLYGATGDNRVKFIVNYATKK